MAVAQEPHVGAGQQPGCAAYSAEQLRGMATVVRAAEAVAPTRPHPGVESAKANLVLGRRWRSRTGRVT